MINKISRNKLRKKRHKRIRNKIIGTIKIPRLSIFRSNKNIYVQIIDDIKGKTLLSASDLKNNECINKIEKAKFVGKKIAKLAKINNIKFVVFDRSGYLYHGRIKALAEEARKNGLIF